MWATGVVDLGLAPEYLWSLTPAEYSRLFDVHLAREDRANRRAALIACYVGNYAGKMRRDGQPPLQIEDVLGHGSPQGYTASDLERFKRTMQTPDDFLNRLRAADPQAEITMSRAVLDAVDRGFGRWDKLGTREGLTQPLAIIKAMNPGWKQ
jgi:hypothetical protein